MFKIDIFCEENEVISEIVVDSFFFDENQYTYAFYLYEDGKKTDHVWYSNKMSATFNLEDKSQRVLFIRAFIRDLRDKSVRTYDSKKISINN